MQLLDWFMLGCKVESVDFGSLLECDVEPPVGQNFCISVKVSSCLVHRSTRTLVLISSVPR